MIAYRWGCARVVDECWKYESGLCVPKNVDCARVPHVVARVAVCRQVGALSGAAKAVRRFFIVIVVVRGWSRLVPSYFQRRGTGTSG